MAPPNSSFRRRSILPDLGILLGALVLIGVTWIGAIVAAGVQRQAALHEVRADAASTAVSYMDEVHREILAVDQTLNILEVERLRDPAGFNLSEWRRRLIDLSDMVPEIFMLNARGVVVASTASGMVGTDLAGRPYFEALRRAGPGRPLISAPIRDNNTGNWEINITRRIDGPDREFLGAIVVAYNVAALTSAFGGSELRRNDFAALIGTDGIIRALISDGFRDPGASIAGTPLMHQITDHASDWIGPSPLDGRTDSFAFSQVPGQDLTVVVGVDQNAAIADTSTWRTAAFVAAGFLSALLLTTAFTLLRALAVSREREARLRSDRSVLADANSALERARSSADAKTAQLQSIITSMSDGISLFDRDLRLVQWNELFSENSGVPREVLRAGLPLEEVLRLQARAGEFGPLGGDAEIATEVERRIAALRAGAFGVSERARPDGRTLELRRARLADGGIVTLYSDVTARKQVEEAHRRARALAEAAAEQKSRFAAIVSHEVRTPLNVTLNALALLEQSTLDSEQRRLTDMATQAGEALRSLLNDILDLSRLEVGRLSLRPAECELRPLLEGVVAMFRAQAAERGINFGLRIRPGVPPRMVTDPARLRQVLLNLVSNAVKFAARGAARLTASVAVEQGRSVLLLSVRNPGRAIAEEDRPALFRPFSQLGEGRPGAGAGLGLAICQELVGLLGGNIGYRVVAQENEFWITLPLNGAAVAEPPVEENVAPRSARMARARVLLADDVPANRTVIAALLRREGHAVEEASDGEAAVECAARRLYDIVLMDVNMPGIGGLEATRRIRALEGPSGRVPILALTANVAPEERESCRDAGMDDALPKPVERVALAEAVQRYLRSRHHRAEPAPAMQDAVEIPLLDLARIGDIAGQLPAGMFAGLLEGCLDDLRQRLPALESALAEQRCAEASAVAHAMAGVAAGYGAALLAERLRGVMEAARIQDAPAASAHGEGLAALLAETEAAFRALPLLAAV